MTAQENKQIKKLRGAISIGDLVKGEVYDITIEGYECPQKMVYFGTGGCFPSTMPMIPFAEFLSRQDRQYDDGSSIRAYHFILNSSGNFRVSSSNLTMVPVTKYGDFLGLDYQEKDEMLRRHNL